jgi:MurNAc alpha-1-phosphate uridylyltransferase
VLDSLERVGVERVVVNAHYLAEAIEAHLSARRGLDIVVSREETLLGSGGGVAKALPELGDGPFYVLNSDVVVLDGVRPALWRLARAWCDESMDALLLCHATVRAFGYDGRGDFVVDPEGRLRRRREREIAPCLFTGVQVLHPRLFDGCPQGPFSLNAVYDQAEKAGRLYGIVHDGAFLHIGTPEALADAEHYLHELS